MDEIAFLVLGLVGGVVFMGFTTSESFQDKMDQGVFTHDEKIYKCSSKEISEIKEIK